MQISQGAISTGLARGFVSSGRTSLWLRESYLGPTFTGGNGLKGEQLSRKIKGRMNGLVFPAFIFFLIASNC